MTQKIRLAVSCSFEELYLIDTIKECLIHDGITPIIIRRIQSNNLIDVIEKTISSADILVFLITENYIKSSQCMIELSAYLLQKNKIPFLPVIVGDIPVPYYLAVSYIYLAIDNLSIENIEKITENIIELMYDLTLKESDDEPNDSYEEIIKNLKNAYMTNRLTLICGAGVSIDAGVPSWNVLLSMVLKKALKNQIKMNDNDVLSTSNLILGRYLKILLGNDFESVIKECLYKKGVYSVKSKLLKAIADFICTQDNKRVESVITYNFDSLLEDILTKNKVKHKALYKQNINVNNDEIPIFHVHGYLPQYEKLDDYNIIFSEEEYHTQFIDPYSWANVTQLYKLMNNVCLLIGISMTDPNLRRLLDIAKRESMNNRLQHYIIKKIPNEQDNIKKFQMMLEEQDANLYGIKVIWIKDFKDIPNIFLDIRKY